MRDLRSYPIVAILPHCSRRCIEQRETEFDSVFETQNETRFIVFIVVVLGENIEIGNSFGHYFRVSWVSTVNTVNDIQLP